MCRTAQAKEIKNQVVADELAVASCMCTVLAEHTKYNILVIFAVYVTRSMDQSESFVALFWPTYKRSSRPIKAAPYCDQWWGGCQSALSK